MSLDLDRIVCGAVQTLPVPGLPPIVSGSNPAAPPAPAAQPMLRGGAVLPVPGPRGERGEAGAASTVPGPPGISAYQAWLNLGNTGDEAAFIASLRGTAGTDASQRVFIQPETPTAPAPWVWYKTLQNGEIELYVND